VYHAAINRALTSVLLWFDRGKQPSTSPPIMTDIS
jgi:hypothetical protein